MTAITTKRNHFTFGVVTGLLLVALNMIIFFSGNVDNPWLGTLNWVIIVGGVIWSCIAFSNVNDNQVTFGQTFGNGFRTTAIIALIMVAWAILGNLMFPEMKELILSRTMEKMAKNGMQEEEVEKAFEKVKNNWMILAVSGAAVGTVFQGVIGSLIGAAVAKKKPAMPSFDNL